MKQLSTINCDTSRSAHECTSVQVCDTQVIEKCKENEREFLSLCSHRNNDPLCRVDEEVNYLNE